MSQLLITNSERKWLRACTLLAPLFSTCAKKQYFACVLAHNNRVAGIGYNGAPPGMGHCVDGHCPRLLEESSSGSQYDNCIAQHAEAGALLWSDTALRQGGTLVVNGPPCMGCAKLIASSSLVRLVCLEDPSYRNWHSVRDFLHAAGVMVISIPKEHL